MVLLQFSWRRGSKDSRGQGVKCLLSNEFVIVLSILKTSATLLKYRYFRVFHSNPWILGPLNPWDHSSSFGDDPKVYSQKIEAEQKNARGYKSNSRAHLRAQILKVDAELRFKALKQAQQ